MKRATLMKKLGKKLIRRKRAAAKKAVKGKRGKFVKAK